jgi:hypothetical protein
MATCDIAAGRGKACKNSISGVRKVYLNNYLADPWTIVSGQVTAMNVLLTEAFVYDLSGDGQVLDENMVGDRNNGTRVNTQTITAILQGIDAATSAELNLVTAATPQAVIQTRDGNYHAVGLTDGIDFTVVQNTGSAKGDLNGYTLTGISTELDLSPILDSATVTAFLAVVAVNP